MSDRPLGVAIEIDTAKVLPSLTVVKGGLRDTQAALDKFKANVATGLAPAAAAFGQLGRAIDQERAALARAAALHDEFARKNQPLVKSFGQIADQIAREKSVLDDIRRPQQQYFDTLMALDKLQERNVISTEEYVDRVTKLNRSVQATPSVVHEHAEHGAGKEVLGHVGEAVGGKAGGIIGAIAEGGVMGLAVEGVHSLIEAFDEMGESARRNAEELIQMKDKLTELRNETRKFEDAGHTNNQILEEQAELAHDLHSGLDSTISVYDAVREGSDDLNLTHAEQIKLTRTLGEDLLNNNKSLGDAGGLMENFAFAMKNGGLSSLQFTQIAKQVPGVVKEWEEHFHLSQKALGDAVSSGKIGIQQLLDVTIQGGQGIEKEWSKHTRTVGEYRDDLKEAYEIELAQSGDKSMVGKYEAIRKALAEAGSEGVDNAQRLKDAVATLGEEFKGPTTGALKMQLSVELASGALDQQEHSAATLSQTFARLSDNIFKLSAREAEANEKIRVSTATIKTYALTWLAVAKSNQIASDAGLHVLGDVETRHRAATTLADDNKALKKLLDEGRISAKDYRDEWKALNGVHEEAAHKLTAEEQMLQRLHGAYDQADKDLATVEVLYAQGKISLGEYNDELARNRDILGEPVKSATGGLGSIAPANIGELPADATGKAYRDAVADGVRADLAKEQTEANFKALEAAGTQSANRVEDAWKQASSAINNFIMQTVTTGKADFGDLGSAIERIIMQLALSGLSSGIAGLFKSGGGGGGNQAALDAASQIGTMLFAYGGDVAVGSRGLARLPHAAYGADFMVGGVGGIDTKLAQLAVSPGEIISVRNPQQQMAAAQESRGAARIVNHYNMMFDRRAVISNRDDDERVLASLRRQRSSVRAVTRQR